MPTPRQGWLTVPRQAARLQLVNRASLPPSKTKDAESRPQLEVSFVEWLYGIGALACGLSWQDPFAFDSANVGKIRDCPYADLLV